ncbi:MAG TPA: substrate-binding domain-containing protein [Paraburkholderia sp.]
MTTNVALTGIGSMATKKLLARLCDAYRAETGQGVEFMSVGGVEAEQRLMAGEQFDFAVLASGALERLAAHGRVEAERTGIVCSRIAAAVPAGAPHPDLGSAAALRDAMLRAPTLGYSTGPSGDYLLALFARLGIAEEIAPRLVQAPPGVPVGTLLAQGRIALGFQQLSELIGLAGVEVIGLLPDEVQHVTVFAAAVSRQSSRQEAARAFFAFLTGPKTDAEIRAHGMEPARA